MPHAANLNGCATQNDEVVPATTITATTSAIKTRQHPKDNNNSGSICCKDSSQHQSETPKSTAPNLKTSIYDWDSPSSFTGTVKRRPHSLATTPSPSTSASASTTSSPSASPTTTDNVADKAAHIALGGSSSLRCLRASQVNNNTEQRCCQQHNGSRVRRKTIHALTTVISTINTSTTTATTTNRAEVSTDTKKMLNMHKSHRNKEKPSKLRLTKTSSDRNANSTSDSPTTSQSHMAAVGGTIRKASKEAQNRTANARDAEERLSKTSQQNQNLADSELTYTENYMELNFLDPMFQTAEVSQFTELFCDFPVSYESTAVITNTQFAKHGLVTKPPPQPPPYREPPPPTPPPLSQLPTREQRLLAQQNAEAGGSMSAPATPSRGKVVLSKKERKELSKLSKLHDNCTAGSNSNLGGFELNEGGSASAHSSPYKGRVTELKNCIAKINSRGLFASLNRSSQKSLNSQSAAEDPPSSNDGSPPPPAPDTSPPSSAISNNNDADYSEKLKNLPVRQRKAHISHMDNYCLFDPVDFINEKAMRQRTHAMMNMLSSTQAHGLRDPLFSSRQNLDFSEEEKVPEVIYDEKAHEEVEEACGGDEINFEHHNYFVIDPDEFEPEPILDIGIPNPFTNDQFVSVKLQAVCVEHENDILPASTSMDKLLEAYEAAPSMSNSQESKDTNTTTSTTTTTNTSTALVESSTSTNSTSSTSSSAALPQTTTQRTKKKLTFLNLSPFRSQNSKNSSDDKNSKPHSSDNKSNERAISELVTSDHILHLQHMLLESKESMRSRTVPIESNYVLFNPGPVPSRSLQYKIRKPRPLSTHSDADSGFLSPCSPDELSSLKFNPAILVLQQCDSVQGYIEIYTDWANYYLERAKSKKKVTDLSADCRDGLLLADVIEAVTAFKVPDLVKKPKNQQQMFDNVNVCLNVLRAQAVGGLDNITSSDICAGRLKAVLALFFALSRYKQQSKQTKCGGGSLTGSIKAEIHQQPLTADTNQQHQQSNTTNTNANVLLANTQTCGNQQQLQQQQQTAQNVQSAQNGNDTMLNRQIPTAYGKSNGGTAIPLPATVMVQRRCPPDKVRPLPPTPNHTPSIPGLGKSGSDFNTSRPNSPPTSNHTIQSLKSGNNNGLRPPAAKLTHQSGIPPPGTTALPPTTAPPQKHSMLDKLKLFNKEKQQQQNTVTATAINKNQVQSKRTSSSSGFSSARSERSDSSLSLNDGHISQIKPPTVSVTANKCKISTKQTKLLAAQLKKEQVKASKLEKKEKSPARSLNKEESGAESKNSTIGRTKNSLPRVSEKNSAKTSSKCSLNSKSDSKSSLIMPPSKSLNSPNSSTGLPKPIAAIKGTSKLPQPPTPTNENKIRLGNHDILKREKSDISTNTPTNISERSREYETPRTTPSNTHIVKPVPILPEPGAKPPYYVNAGNISQPQESSQLESPPPQRIPTQEPNYSNGCSRLPPPKTGLATTPTRKLEYNAGPTMLSPQRSPLRVLTQSPHSPPDTPSSSPIKFHTIPSKIVGTIYEEERPVSVLPMRPLLRGYNSHVTLPTRSARGAHHYVTEFCEHDIGQGYCSDGDALRVSSARLTHGSAGAGSIRFPDIDNGYLSEGSCGVGLSPSAGAAANGGGGAGAHGKHFLSIMRARTQLPTTIEERIRNSRGSLDSIGTAPPSSAASQASSSGGSNNKMDLANGGGSANGSPHSSPQHHHGHHGSHRSGSRNGRDNWSKMPEPLNGHKADKAEKSPSRRNVASGSSSKQGSPSGRTKGVPPSFGYVKRANGSATATAEQQNILMMGGGGGGGICGQNGMGPGGRTAHVSAVPRTAGSRKVSGGTQTLPNDMTNIPPNTQHRSFSLTGPGATQLSQSIRERLATGSHSLPKPNTDMHIFQHRMSTRSGKMIDGSLSDTQTYAEVKPEYSTYAMWLKHSNTAGSRLSEGDSLENMQIGSPAMTRHGHKMLQHRNTAAGLMNAGGAGMTPGGPVPGSESPYVQSPRLNRSNSIRSTKSEKMYPSMLSRGPEVEAEPYYCLPVGSIAAQNGVLSAQMAAVAAAAAATHVGAQVGSVGGVGSVAWSQPTSPTPLNRGFGGTLSPTHGGALGLVGNLTSAVTTGHRLTYPKKNDEVHGSAASLLSGGSSLYGSAEERQANEIRRLKRELIDAREQVLSLSSQLSTNAHVVAAFEQSLANMTSRLHQLTATAERKDGELTDMRQTIELLRKQSIQAGLTTAHMQSMGVQTQGQNQNDLLSSKPPPLPGTMPGQHMSRAAQHQQLQLQHQQQQQHQTNGTIQRHHSSDSMCSLNSISSGCSAQDKKKKKGWLRSSFTKAFSRNAKISKTSRHAGGHHGHHSNSQGDNTSSQGSTAGLAKVNGHGHHMEPAGLAALATQPAPTLPATPTKSSPAKTVTLIDNAKPIDAIDHDDHHVVEDLKKQLREKDLVLTDIRLEALSSASQLESLKDTVNKMRAEMMSLKQNNERLQKMVTSRSLAGSEASLGNAISPSGSMGESRRYSLADGNSRPPMELPKRLEEEVEEENIPPAPAPEPPPPPLSPTTHIDLTPPPPALDTIPSPAHIPAAVEELPDVTDGKKIAIACYLGQPDSFAKYCEEMLEMDDFYANGDNDGNERMAFPAASRNEFVIAYTYISGKTTWQNLDYIVRKTFKDYVSRIDPGTNLGLNTDSITSYHLGEAKRGPEMGFPELLPCGYIIGNVRTLYICLQGVGSLAFDSLIPRSIVHRYISLLTEHRRLILCGPSGTGKSYLARRLAEFLVARSGRGNPSEAIATFNVDHKSSKELRQYLGHIAEQAAIANGASELPSVIILDNLHHASALGDVFSCLLSAGPAAKLPCIIGTMSQATCNTTNLQLHHNFRWVLTANHMEPVKGFLGRFLRRRLFQLELQTQHPQPELASVLAWLPTVWQHINRFLEIHSSSDVTIGPRLFLACPLGLKDSQVWFTDVWNYHLSPYLVEAVREGVQLYGRRGGAWNDPSVFIRNSYPWPYGPDSVPPLRQINAEDVGLEGVAASNGENQDPLLNMLMRLQEAANYSENQDQESDCASLDSNITPDSSAGAE